MQGKVKITDRELHFLEDCLKAEAGAMKKCQLFAAATSDPEVSEICKKMANKHLQHYNTLILHLQSDKPTKIH